MPDTGRPDRLQRVQDSTCNRRKHGGNSAIFNVDEQVVPCIFEDHVTSIDRPLAGKSGIRRIVPQILQWLTRHSIGSLEPGESSEVAVRGKILADSLTEVKRAPVSLAQEQFGTPQTASRHDHRPRTFGCYVAIFHIGDFPSRVAGFTSNGGNVFDFRQANQISASSWSRENAKPRINEGLVQRVPRRWEATEKTPPLALAHCLVLAFIRKHHNLAVAATAIWTSIVRSESE